MIIQWIFSPKVLKNLILLKNRQILNISINIQIFDRQIFERQSMVETKLTFSFELNCGQNLKEISNIFN